jgi:hypothetical protein
VWRRRDATLQGKKWLAMRLKDGQQQQFTAVHIPYGYQTKNFMSIWFLVNAGWMYVFKRGKGEKCGNAHCPNIQTLELEGKRLLQKNAFFEALTNCNCNCIVL